jgi:hypothetical protein
MWCRMDLVRTDVSEKHVASIFRLEKPASEKSVSSYLTVWGRHVPPKRRLLQDPRGATSRVGLFFIIVSDFSETLTSTAYIFKRFVTTEIKLCSPCLKDCRSNLKYPPERCFSHISYTDFTMSKQMTSLTSLYAHSCRHAVYFSPGTCIFTLLPWILQHL